MRKALYLHLNKEAKMRFIIVGLLIILLQTFTSCEKSTKIWTVNFQVEGVSEDIKEYRVRYIAPDGAEVTKGPFQEPDWTSDDIVYEDGTYVFFEIELLDGRGSYTLNILRDGALHESGMSSNQTFRIEDNI